MLNSRFHVEEIDCNGLPTRMEKFIYPKNQNYYKVKKMIIDTPEKSKNVYLTIIEYEEYNSTSINAVYFVEPEQYAIKDSGDLIFLIPSDCQIEENKSAPLMVYKQSLKSISRLILPKRDFEEALSQIISYLQSEYPHIPKSSEMSKQLRFYIIESLSRIRNLEHFKNHCKEIESSFKNETNNLNIKNNIGLKLLVIDAIEKFDILGYCKNDRTILDILF